MSRLRPASIRIIFLCLFTMPLLFALGLRPAFGQCPEPPEDVDTNPHPVPKFPDIKQPPTLEEPILPEAGFLSDSHYTSQFFGFSLDLPITVRGHEIMMAVMPEREHALVSLQFEKGPQNGYITITALDPRPGMDAKTPDQQIQAQIRSWAQTAGQVGTTPPFPIPDYMMHTGHFYYSLRHNGGVFAAQYWTAINNYVVKVVIGTNDKDFLSRAKKAMAEVKFYCPQEDGTLINSKGQPVKVEGEPYQGPTVPTFRVNTAIKDQPSKNIQLGQTSNGVYSNDPLGLKYDLPHGWQVLPGESSDPPPPDESREYQFLHACSQTLLRTTPPVPKGQSYEDGPVIVLRALDYNCLSMRPPITLSDKRALDEVAATLEQTGEFGQINTDQVKMISGHLFMEFHGTVAVGKRGEDLSQRLMQTIYVTRFNKMLLVWSFMAPTTKELEQIPAGGITLEGLPPIELRTTLRAEN